MARGIKIALPGYNAETDTDPNHFSLYVDEDDPNNYILIKEKAKASVVVSSSQVIPHGLSYVPLCLVFKEMSAGVWRRVYSGNNFNVDATNLTIYGSGTYAYHIFLDNLTTGSATLVDLGDHLAFVVAKHGVNAELATDPNDFIFHSDYNTFKIVVEGTKTVTLAASTTNQSFTQAHNQKFIPLCHAFAKETARAQVFLANSENVSSWGIKAGILGTGIIFNYVNADATNLTFNFDNTTGSSVEVSIRYFVLEKIV